MMSILPLIVFICVLPILFLTFSAFDQLVVLQHDRYPEQWNADGKPNPFWPRDGYPRGFRNGIASQKCNFTWLFSTPKWARDDADAKRLMRRMRTLVALWAFGALPLFALSGLLAAAYHP